MIMNLLSCAVYISRYAVLAFVVLGTNRRQGKVVNGQRMEKERPRKGSGRPTRGSEMPRIGRTRRSMCWRRSTAARVHPDGLRRAGLYHLAVDETVILLHPLCLQ